MAAETLEQELPAGEFLVNSATQAAQNSPVVTRLASGGFVVSWADEGFGASGGSGGSPIGIKIQRFDADGNKVGGEVLANSGEGGYQTAPEVAALSTGGFIVSWTNMDSGFGDEFVWEIRGQIFDAAGSKVGGEITMSTPFAGGERFGVEVTSLAGGGFVATWAEALELFERGTLEIKGQLFSATGAKIGGEFQVNTVTAGAQEAAVVAPLASGGFVVSWQTDSHAGDTSVSGIKAQIFDSAAAKVGGELFVNSVTSGSQSHPSIATLPSGRFVVSWADGGGSAVKGQLFEANGAKVGGEFLISTTSTGGQVEPSVTAIPSGGFAVTWTSSNASSVDNSGTAVHAQLFDADGNRVGRELLVNGATAGNQGQGVVAALSADALLFSWTDASGQGGDSSSTGIKARIIALPLDEGPTSGSDLLYGTEDNDQFFLEHGGDDTVFMLGGNDIFHFGAAFTALDKADGGAGADRLILGGAYSGGIQFNADTMVDVETLSLGSAGGAGYFSYNLTLHNGNVAAGQLLTVDGSSLRYGEALMFYGGAETDGRFTIRGGASHDYIFGGQGDDLIRGGLGSDTLRGNGGADLFSHEGLAEFTGDRIDGGGGIDRVELRGAFNSGAVFSADTMVNVETLFLHSAGGTGYFSYNLTLNNGNVAAGQTLTVDGTALRYGEALMFYGSSELDGRFAILGGASNDYLNGGQGNDLIRGGLGRDYLKGNGGADTFAYLAAAEATGLQFDQLVGFDYRVDRIDLPGSVSGWTGHVQQGALRSASFDADLAAALNGALQANSAVLFTASQGDFAGRTFAVVDGNGDGNYQAGQDYVFEFVSPVVPVAQAPEMFV